MTDSKKGKPTPKKKKRTPEQNKNKRIQPKIIYEGDDVYFMTSLRKKVKLLPVSPYLLQNVQAKAKEDWIEGYKDDFGNEIEGRGDIPQIPTYTTMVGETEVEIEHDETTLEDTDDPEQAKENVKAWEKYQEDLETYDTFHTTRIARVILHGGIDIEYPPENDDWAIHQETVLRATVPADEPLRKMHYIETVILGSQYDVGIVVAEVMALIGVDREEVDRIKAEVFQSQISQKTSGVVDTKEELPVDSK